MFPQNKFSFSAPGGVVRGLGLWGRAKICAWELASVVSRRPPVVSRGPPLVSRGLLWSPVVSRCLLYLYFYLLGPKFVRGLCSLPWSPVVSWSLPWSPVVSLGLPLLSVANVVWGHSPASFSFVLVIV